MLEFTAGNQIQNMQKAIDACRLLIKTLSNPDISPLEREAGYVLAKALRMQLETMGILDNPDVKEFLRLQEETRPTVPVMRYPDDFEDLPGFAKV